MRGWLRGGLDVRLQEFSFLGTGSQVPVSVFPYTRVEMHAHSFLPRSREHTGVRDLTPEAFVSLPWWEFVSIPF